MLSGNLEAVGTKNGQFLDINVHEEFKDIDQKAIMQLLRVFILYLQSFTKFLYGVWFTT